MKRLFIIMLVLCLGQMSGIAQTTETSVPVPTDTILSDRSDVDDDSVAVNREWDLRFAEDSIYLMEPKPSKKHHKIVVDSLNIELPKNISLKRTTVFHPNPIRSMWLGLVFPGGGQIYNRKYWKLPIFYGGYLGCVYAFSWNSQMLRDYSQAYLDIMDDDPNTKSYEKMLPLGYSIEGREDRFKAIFKAKKDYFRKYRDMSIFAFAGVYLLSVIDAYVDAELSTFDISRDLSLRWTPAVIGNDMQSQQRLTTHALGVQCSLSY